jgi:hypothetical protein
MDHGDQIASAERTRETMPTIRPGHHVENYQVVAPGRKGSTSSGDIVGG